jgi:hypothetical protein
VVSLLFADGDGDDGSRRAAYATDQEGRAKSAREAVAKFAACLDVCRRAVPPNHDLATLGLKATAECLAHLAALAPAGTSSRRVVVSCVITASMS